MKDFFKNLFDYNYDANQTLWHMLDANRSAASEKSLKLYAHILNAHQIWNNRLEHRRVAFDVWAMHDLRACQDIDKENYAHTLEIVRTLDLNNTTEVTLRGKKVNKTPADVLFHIINHSTYHRAQIATEFRQAGIPPLVSDFILFERDH